MKRLYVRTIWGFTVLAVVAGPAIGQRPTRQLAQDVVTTDGRAGISAVEVFDRPVTLTLDRVPLKRAVDAIAATAGVRVQYQGQVLDAVTTPVTLHAARLPLGAALARVLEGTDLRAHALAADVVAIKEGRERAEVVQGTITGTVTNAKTTQRLSNATVFLDDAKQGVTTGSDGTFRIAASPGVHTITVRVVGFVRQAKQVTVSEGQSAAIEVQLEPSTSVLDEVVVTGTVVATERKAIANPITVITAADIERRGITRIDQFFRGEVPGVIVVEEGTKPYGSGFTTWTDPGNGPQLGNLETSKIYVRGASGVDRSRTPLKTFIDGVELLNPSYLGTIDPKSIERIEIITGPQAATIYGSGAMGGVMQIFTKKGSGGRAPDMTLSLKYGVLENNVANGLTPSHNHGLNIMGGSGPEFSYSGTLSYTYTGQWQPALFVQRYGASAGVTHTRDRGSVSASYSSLYGRNGLLPSCGSCYASSPFVREMDGTGELQGYTNARLYAERVSTSASQTLSLAVDYRAWPAWQHHLTVGKSTTDFAVVPTAPMFAGDADSLYSYGSSDGDRLTVGYNTTLQHSGAMWSSSLTVGGNLSTAGQTRIGACKVSKDATAYIPCGWDTYQAVAVTEPMRERTSGGFGSFRVGLFDKLYGTVGVRGERNGNYGSQYGIDWTPTTGLAYTMERGDLSVKLLTSYGRATRAPSSDQRLEEVTIDPYLDPSQITTRFANPELAPEYSSGPQGGIEVYYGNLGSFTINRYRQTISNLIQFVLRDSVLYTCAWCGGEYYYYGQYQYRNVAKVRQHGWETTASLNLGLWSLKGTYSWTDSRVLASDPSLPWYVPGQTFNNLPTHMGNVTASYARGGTSATLVMNYVGSNTQTEDDLLGTVLSTLSRIPTYLPRYSYSSSRRTKPGYVKSDLAVSQRLTSWASATLNVQNLGNSLGSETSNLYPTIGRQTAVGVSLRYPAGR